MIGTWCISYEEDGEEYYEEYTFNPDLTWPFTMYLSDKVTVEDNRTGTYRTNGNILQLWFDDPEDEEEEKGIQFTFFVKGNKLYMTGKGANGVLTKK